MFTFGEIWESTSNYSNLSNYDKHTQSPLLTKKERINIWVNTIALE